MQQILFPLVGSLLLFLAAVGCSRPQHSEIASLPVIVPGFGISNILARGMTLDEIKSRTDAVFTDQPDGGYWCDVPSLGASFQGSWEQEKLRGGILFYVIPHSNAPAVSFTGSLSCGLSFAKDQKVTRSDVVRVFGLPEKRLDGDITAKEMGMAYHYGKQGVSFSLAMVLKDGMTHETLSYRAKGITFFLTEDLVTMLRVEEPALLSGKRPVKLSITR